MASSPASQGGHHRRRQNARRQPLARTNTLLSAIKNIVAAPLSWFASTDDFEDSRDSSGKRRRLAVVPTEPALEEEEQAPRTKRMRVDSPPRELQREGAYLDPPTTLFEQPSSISHSVSTSAQSIASQLPAVGITGNYVRSTLSPLRNLSVSRTMSIDPPPRPQSRDGSAFQSQRLLDSNQDMDSSMESVHPLPPLSASSATSFPRVSISMPRDFSVPNSRPPFRMRTSLTPQPAQVQRERSEPPPLQLLRARPTFVKAPPIDEGSSPASNEPGATLGSLVESVRRTQSPARQHSSLLFGGKTQVESKHEMSRAQKALHELEIYKTPLLPTRLRNGAGQASITGVPDLFRPRRKLVLMKDEDRTSDRKLGRKESVSPDKNGTKPYAGAGGMKKMLAKRKLELEETGGDEGGEASEKTEKVREKEKDVSMEAEKVERSPSISKEVPPLPKNDWYSLASGTSSGAGTSSLRVGRAKSSRNHISRPTARPKAKFSAAFEEGDDLMLDEDKEREMLEEAAQNAPVFNIPLGFSFAKDVKPIEHDATGAKEPPIKSLPFSFTGPPAPSIFPTEKETEVSIRAAPSPSSQPPPTTTLPFSFKVPSVNISSIQEKPISLFGPPLTPTSKPTEVASSNGGVPNFFVHSAAFKKPLEIKTPPLTFSAQPTEPPKVEATAPAPSPAPLPVFSLGVSSSNTGTPSVSSGETSLFGSPAPSLPGKDIANPLWDGEKKTEDSGKDQVQTASTSIFGVPVQREKPVDQVKAPAAPTPSLFGDASKVVTTPTSLFSAAPAKPAEAPEDAKPSTFVFGGSSATPSLFGAKPANEGNSVQAEPAVSLFGIQPSTSTSAPSGVGFTSSTGGSLFGASSTTDTAKPAISPFGTTVKPTFESEKPTNGFGTVPSAPASTTMFSFGQQASPPTTEASKPVVSSNGSVPFGGVSSIPKVSSTILLISRLTVSNEEAKPTSSSPFKFGAPENETKAGSPTPFSFGAPSTPQAAEKSAPFTFGTPASPVPPSSGFAFGAGASTTSDVSKPLQVDRPITPPKNGEQEFKMEESPTREVQQANVDNKSIFTGFSFGNPPSTGSVLFGGPTSAPPTTTTPFPFSSSSPSNLFAAPPMKESKSEGPKPFTFGQSSASVPAPAINTGFTFGQTPQKTGSPRPSTAGSFGDFGGGSGTPTSTTSGFNFGAPTSNPFGQQSGGSAPSSPSTFQPSGFNFGGTTSGTGFGFGSQPASPATGSTNLPPSGTPFGAGATGFNASAPSSPFSAPTQIAPSTSSGGTLFTIGAAPPPQQAQGRQIKKLPNRARTKR